MAVKTVCEFVKAQRCYIILQPPVSRFAIVAFISRAYYGPCIERAKSNISRYKLINGENLYRAKLRVLNETTFDSTSTINLKVYN